MVRNLAQSARYVVSGASVLLAVLCSQILEALVITEIHYHPSGSADVARRLEYVEIYNDDPGPLDLTGYYFSEGVAYTFPERTILQGGQYLVIAADEDFLRALFGLAPIIGNWSSTTALDNGGERISIANRSGVIVASVNYNDRNRWPAAADGTGHSLALRRVFRDNNDADNWAASDEIGGTPGRENFVLGLNDGGEQPEGDPVDENGFILQWLVLGPYRGASCNPGDEINADWLTEGPMGRQETHLFWEAGQAVRTDYGIAASTGLHSSAGTSLPTLQPYQAFHDTIDFDDEVYGSSVGTMAYAITYVFNTSGGPLNADMALASDDSIQILIDGVVVHTNEVCRTSGPSGSISDYVPVTLAEGKNLVMVKLFHSGGDWQFRLRFEDPDSGSPMGVQGPWNVLTASISPTGTPGVSSPDGLSINEALIDTAGPRWVEFYNSTTNSINIGGLHLTDSQDNLTKGKIPADTLVPGKGWLALEDTALGLDFSLDVPGGRDRVFIGLVDASGTSVIDAYTFRPTVPEHSEARIPDGSGDMVEAADPTRDGKNQVTVNNWIVINEIQYHPTFDDPVREYLELRHRGSGGDPDVDLSGWQLTQGLNFVFPEGTSMSPGDYLVVAHDPALLQSIYDLSGVQVLGPDPDPLSIETFGILRNSGERVTLVDDLGKTVDTFRYVDGGHWARWPDGGGPSLELIDPWSENDSPQAWDASDEPEKSEVQEFSYSAQHVGGESELHFHLLGSGITVIDDIFLGGSGSVTTTEFLIDIGDDWHYFKGWEEPSIDPEDWRQVEFDDSSWDVGPTGIGYDDGDDATILADMRFNYVSVYCRREFEVGDLTDVLGLRFDIDFDDGYVAYLNGVEISRQGLGGNPPLHTDLAASHDAGTFSILDISQRINLLQQGTNVLAVQVHNTQPTSTDLTFRPRLALLRPAEPGEQGNNLLANGDFDSSTSGWVIEGNHIHSGRTAVDSITGAGSLKLIATGRGDNKANRLETEVPSGLSAGVTYEVSFRARWIVGARSVVTRGYNHGLARSHQLLIPDNLGTPGAENSVTSRQKALPDDGNLGPVIDNVSQSPVLPAASQPVTIRARIRDTEVTFPVVRYALNSPNAGFSSVGMTGPDENGYYEAEVPGQSARTRVLFEILAQDGSAGASARYPVDQSERTHPLLLNRFGASASDLRWAIYHHDTKPVSAYPVYQFVMHEEDERELGSQRLLSNRYANGSFIFEDKIYYHSDLRFAGSAWARAPWGSFRIRMPKDNRLQAKFSKMNFDMRHNQPRDARERIGHYLAGQNGGISKVPFLHLRFVHLDVNTRFGGDREQVEVPGRDFVSNWFPDDDQGDLFEMDDRFEFNDAVQRVSHQDAFWRYPPYGGDGSNKEQYRFFFGRRTEEDADDYDNIISTARVLTASITSNAQFDSLVDDHFAVQSFLRVLAVRLNINDWDTWGVDRGKNAYFYRGDIGGQWYLVPWDLELSFDDPNRFTMPSSPVTNWRNRFPEVDRFLNRPCVKRQYYGILKEMVDGAFSPEYLDPYLDLLEDVGARRTDVGRPGGYISRRDDLIRNWIRSSVYPEKRLTITTNGGANHDVNEPSLTLDGTSPAEILFLRVIRNGLEVEPAPAVNVCDGGFFDWIIDEIPLESGDNEIEIMGFDGQGELVDSDSITVKLFDTQLFLRGDANEDDVIDIIDVMLIAFYTFEGFPFPRCEDAADVDDNGFNELTDAIVLLRSLYVNGPPPAPPYPRVGLDPTEDGLLDCLNGS